MSTFYESFTNRRKLLKSALCVGLDPDPHLLPWGYSNTREGWLEFTEDVVRSTADLALAYKPNLAFFEALEGGLELFGEVVRKIRDSAPGALIIADAKRGDIRSTAEAYARAFLDRLDCDAVTVNPYMGLETLEPFYRRADKAAIVLCLTSNPGAEQFQMKGTPPLYELVAREVADLNRKKGNLWLVVGATKSSEQIARLRALAPGVPFLVPGIGAQGGNLSDVMEAAGPNVLINATRSVIYCVKERENLPAACRKSALELVEEMRGFL